MQSRKPMQAPTPPFDKPGTAALRRHVDAAVRRERERIARELHDEMGATLTALRLEVAALRGGAVPLDSEARARVDKISEMLGDCMRAKRQLVRELWPAPQSGMDLEHALRSLCMALAAGNDAPRLDFAPLGVPLPSTLPGPVAHVAFRVVQEALTNVLNHARARQAHVAVSVEMPWLMLTVADDGRGFDTGSLPLGGGHGLMGMRARVLELQGHWQLHSAPGRGTSVQVALPLPATAPWADVKPVF
jgi:signal transduction histidine kinase